MDWSNGNWDTCTHLPCFHVHDIHEAIITIRIKIRCTTVLTVRVGRGGGNWRVRPKALFYKDKTIDIRGCISTNFCV